jgi:hypothetical protein
MLVLSSTVASRYYNSCKMKVPVPEIMDTPRIDANILMEGIYEVRRCDVCRDIQAEFHSACFCHSKVVSGDIKIYGYTTAW